MVSEVGILGHHEFEPYYATCIFSSFIEPCTSPKKALK